MSSTQAAPSPTQSAVEGSAQSSSNISIIALLTAIGTGIAASGAQILVFILIKNKLVRILYVSLLLPYRVTMSAC
jgi:hypothetical protein